MVAGTFFGKGYYMGSDLYAGTISNPKGFFESWDINSLNEHLLAQVVPRRPSLFFGKWFFRMRPIIGHVGLSARIPIGTPIPCPDKIKQKIRKNIGKIPFCFKDPRFSYTLPVWQPFLENVIFICVFRDPATTVASILKLCKDLTVLKSLRMNHKIAFEVWSLQYRHILETHRHKGDWIFIHYNQVFTKDGLDRIERLVGTKINRDFPDLSLNRSKPIYPAPVEAQRAYEQLCALAGYSEDGEEADPRAGEGGCPRGAPRSTATTTAGSTLPCACRPHGLPSVSVRHGPRQRCPTNGALDRPHSNLLWSEYGESGNA
jgi:hypothetical protein